MFNKKSQFRKVSRLVYTTILIPYFFSISRYVLREIQIFRQLSQMPENVYTVKLIDIIINPKALQDPTRLKRVFLVMDYIDFDLRILLEQQSQSSDEHVITILYNILCALNFLHSANLMHRDVKPENILLKEDCTIQFCDFGMSRSMLSS